ncbi:MAG: hypothetical protein ABR589_06675, partial [Chthoniobacterales bacterium]
MNPTDPLTLGLIGAVCLAIIATLTAMLLHRRKVRLANSRTVEEELLGRLEALTQAQERADRMLRDEFSRNREEAAGAAKAQRE